MPNNAELIEIPFNFWAYLQSCAGLPMNAPLCLALWQGVMYCTFIIGALLIFWAISHYVRYRMQLKAALKAQAERDMIADADTIRNFTWAEAGNTISEADMTDPRLADKIKRELDQKRLKKSAGRS